MKIRILIASAVLASAGAAQVDESAAKIRQILTKVQEEMNEIDKLLLQTKQRGDSTKSAQEAITKAGKKVDELLTESKKSQEGVVKQIDELLEELRKMQQKSQQQSQDSSGDEQKSQRPQSGDPMEDQQRSQQSEQSMTPDMVRQRKEEQAKKQQGDKKDQQQQNEPNADPRGREKDKDRGANRRDGTRPESDEERVPTVIDNQRWGLLPRYLESMHSRGGLPEVPEQYRRFYEEYLKEAQKQKGSRAPTGR